jgi:hypothetical protein
MADPAGRDRSNAQWLLLVGLLMAAIVALGACGSDGGAPALGPDGCGLEVDDCSAGTAPATQLPPSTGSTTEAAPGATDEAGPTGSSTPAACTTEAYQSAVRSEIDGGSFMVLDAVCDGTWAAFTVDRSRDSCPAGEGPPPPGCAPGTRADRVFWRSDGGQWRIIAFQGDAGGCGEVLAVEPDFPTAFCQG